jgi:1,4-dihydroxy-2-naphthoyl-CoA hydrolase
MHAVARQDLSIKTRDLPLTTPIWHAGTVDLAAITANGAATMPGFLGIEFMEAGPDWLTARMPVTARVHQPFGRLHGGASVVLAETVASVGASLAVDNSHSVAVGMEINANHIRPARDGFVYATGRCESRGRTSQVWTVRIVDGEDKLVCLSRVTMAVISNERK